ncbi:MAG: Gfo/Idh/MocA family protein [Luteimonas sp.]
MIGGGIGAFIGAVHRTAAQMDGQAELVGGAFSSDAGRSQASGKELFLDPARVYDDYVGMVAAEARMPRERRLDFVVIVTPNHEHFAPAKLLLENGFNVVCDKPMAFDLAQARALREVVAQTGKVFVLTHNYTGNAMVKQARSLVRDGRLGTIRKVVVEYSQGWLATRIEASGHKQAMWRTDPERSGAAGCIGDIGTHAEHLARYVTGLTIDSLCADLSRFVEGRRLDDDANVLLRFRGGAKGVLHCSQISLGEANNLSLRVYGDGGALEWRQQRPDELIVKHADTPDQIWRRGGRYAGRAAVGPARVPDGHPEGYIEAFANVYREAFRAITAEVEGQSPPADLDFPSVDDGVEGMRFVDAVLASAEQGGAWVSPHQTRPPATACGTASGDAIDRVASASA